MYDELEHLQAENELLKKSLKELENTSKILVRRDIDLRDAYDELKQLDKEKSEFISIAAHQLRTPLTSVRFANQMLTDYISSNLDDTQLSILEKARVSIDHMFEMIEDLLIIDALDYGNLKLTYEPVILEGLITEIVDSFKEAVKLRSLTMVTEYSSAGTAVQADRRRIKDAISNLIDNAIKYTPGGGTVTITTSYDSTSATVAVSDSGIGVRPEDVSNLFKKFSRLENAKRMDANGSGLGLYISNKIIEKHNGSITFEPRQPAGSSFTILIPL